MSGIVIPSGNPIIFERLTGDEGGYMEQGYGRDTTSASTKLTYLLVGGGIGAVLALLFAPKSGSELREDIADVTRKGIERSREAAAQIQDKAGEYYEVSRDK